MKVSSKSDFIDIFLSVAMYAVCTDMEPFYIITEYMCNGALLDVLRKEDAKMKLLFDSLISISAQVRLEKRFLHS